LDLEYRNTHYYRLNTYHYWYHHPTYQGYQEKKKRKSEDKDNPRSHIKEVYQEDSKEDY
jgi:hypothetical protein